MLWTNTKTSTTQVVLLILYKSIKVLKEKSEMTRYILKELMVIKLKNNIAKQQRISDS